MERETAFADPDAGQFEMKVYATNYSKGVCIARDPIEQYTHLTMRFTPFSTPLGSPQACAKPPAAATVNTNPPSAAAPASAESQPTSSVAVEEVQ
jgi:hypothetical protein